MGKPRKDNIGYTIGKRYDAMMGRCYRPTDASYKSYGKKGIRVCRDWILDKGNFDKWFLTELNKMGFSPEEFLLVSRRYHIDRIDSHGHYCPENCRIVTIQKNSRNKATFGLTKIISAEGDTITFQSLHDSPPT